MTLLAVPPRSTVCSKEQTTDRGIFVAYCAPMSHQFFMRRCLELAEKGRGKTGVNPMVGAALVRDGNIIAEGYHEEFGKAHAERQLLEKFDQKIDSKDILYVNLEPCCHTKKKTPPCAKLLLERGIKHVVYGMKDPNPEVSGKGIELLIKNGVQVSGPILQEECKRMNRGFVSVMTKGRPWITIKKAQTVEGKTANDDGSMMKITSREQDAWSHRFLRMRHDGILVGLGTIMKDDSRLTVRVPSDSPVVQPHRIVLDPALAIPLHARLVSEPLAAATLLITSPNHDREKEYELRSRGVRIIEIECTNSCFDWPSLWKSLMTPSEDFSGISSLLVEGGPKTWKTFEQAKCVDEEIVLMG